MVREISKSSADDCVDSGKSHSSNSDDEGLDFDFDDPDLYQEPYRQFNALREAATCFKSKTFDSWVFTRYEDIAAALQDKDTFKVDQGSAFYRRCPQKLGPVFRDSLLTKNPPTHTTLKKIFSDRFMPVDTRKLASKIETICESLLAAIEDREEFDFVSQYAYALPIKVIGYLMGFPDEDSEFLKECSAAITRGIEPNLDETQKNATNEKVQSIVDYFEGHIERRISSPKDDLIGRWTKAYLNQEMTKEELLSGCFLIFFAGHETTVNLLSNCIFNLNAFPDQYQKLKNNLNLISKCLEETLRYDNPVHLVGRFLGKDIVMGQNHLKKGETINLLIASGNRDPRKFANPDQFDIERFPNFHLGFGGGIHMCLGMHLARLEGKIALQKLLERYEDISFEELPKRRKTMLITGFDEMIVKGKLRRRN